jgi:hypothetical protein
MTRVETILMLYRKGSISLSTAEAEIACEVTPENVDAIMTQLTPEILESMRRWNLDQVGFIYGSNMTDAEVQRRQALLEVAMPALRSWFERRERARIQPETAALTPPEPVKG